MITRPLDLASRLRPEPRNFDFVFLVNGALIGLFFVLFGSRFVLAPGLGLDFQMPEIAGARAGAVATTHLITVNSSGLIFLPDGPADLSRLRDWLSAEGKKSRHPTLLVRAGSGVSGGLVATITSAAREAGFSVVWGAEELRAPRSGGL
jgi:biopolymer transport protein ExbD